MFCRSLDSKLTLDDQSRTFRLKKLADKARNLFNRPGLFDAREIQALLDFIDQLWFSGALVHAIREMYGPIKIKLEIPAFLRKNTRKPPAGAVYKHNHRLILAMNRPLFYELFREHSLEPPNGYHVGGVVRTNLPDCVSHVLCHEIVHLVLLVCNHKDKSKPHPTVFRDMCLAYFDHTVEKHGLVPGLIHNSDFVSTRRLAKPGSRVLVFVRNTWIPATIVRIGRMYAEVQDQAGQSNRVHIGLVRLAE